MMSTDNYYIGVDVGTGSARASLVREDGQTVASSTEDIATYRDASDHRIFEQSTTNIWSSIAKAIKFILAESKIPPSAVKGLGFDATCSLAVTDDRGEPIVVTRGDSLGSPGDRNVILWADHRAEEEADLINSTGSVVLDYVGGKMSLEMEVPKVLWLKHHMPPSRFAACQFFDLPDFLTYRATSYTSRSCCSLTCKCSYVPESGWQTSFFAKIGLAELAEKGYKQIGEALRNGVLNAGVPVGRGLSERAAAELGLVRGTPVGSGLIDAYGYAGWLGTVAARYVEDGQLSPVPSFEESRHRLAAVAGTSTCHLVQSSRGIFVPGVWGPYKDAVFRDWWINEGGQSSTGQLIDFILTTHPAYPQLVEQAKQKNTDAHTILLEILEQMRQEQNVDSLTELTKDMHMYPDFRGNRSPIADPRMRGSITGLEITTTLPDLALKYSLALESIALQTRHIIDVLNAHGHAVSSIHVSGGQARNARLMRLFADACGMDVVVPRDGEGGDAVVLGAAMLGRFAKEAQVRWGGAVGLCGEGEIKGMGVREQQELLWGIMVEMTPPGTRIAPRASPKEKKLLAAKYEIFLESIEIQKRWRRQMAAAAES